MEQNELLEDFTSGMEYNVVFVLQAICLATRIFIYLSLALEML